MNDDHVPISTSHASPAFNLRVIWQRKRFTIRLGLYLAAFAFLVFMNMPWKTSYEAMLRIEPELSTTGELTSIEAEMDVMQSWSTISYAIEQMNRSVIVKSRRSPFWLHVTYYLEYMLQVFYPVPLHDFAHYQPSIKLDYFNISGYMAPYLGKSFEVVIKNKDTYSLFGPDGKLILTEKLGAIGVATIGEANQRLQLMISQINADEGERFQLIPIELDDFTKDIQKGLKIGRKGFRERSGLMTVEYSNRDPIFAQQVLDALMTTYIAKAYDRSSLGKIRGLDKLKEKSLSLKEQLENAQKELAEFKSRNQLVDLVQDQGTAYKNLVSIQDELRKATAQHKQGLATLTENHPAMMALSGQIKFLQAESDRINKALKELPEKEKEQSRLQSNIDIAKRMLESNTALMAQLYSEVETITGYAHLVSLHEIDRLSPVTRGLLVIILGFLSGVAVGLSWLLRHTAPAFSRIRYEEDLAAVSPLVVVARYPFRWSGTQWLWYRGHNANTVVNEREWYEKASREIVKLEKAVPFLLPDAKKQVLLFTSVDDHEGAGFSARQLSVTGAAERKTLLIDAHVIRPSLHSAFGLSSAEPGLTDLLIGQARMSDVVHETKTPNLFIMPAGTQTHNFRLISDAERMKKLLDTLSQTFDRIVIEFPPLNPNICLEGVLESASAVFVVVHRDISTRKFENTMRSCKINALKTAFLILNKK